MTQVDTTIYEMAPEMALLLSIIDDAIRDTAGHQMVCASDVLDFLLDIRQAVLGVPT
jgi:hypothetical protein